MRGISKLLGESMWFADSTVNPSRVSGMPAPLLPPPPYTTCSRIGHLSMGQLAPKASDREIFSLFRFF